MAENFVLEMAKGISAEQREIRLLLRRIRTANADQLSLLGVFQKAIRLKNELKIHLPDDEFLRVFGFITPKIETDEERMKTMDPQEKSLFELHLKHGLSRVNPVDCLLRSDLQETLEEMTRNHRVCKIPKEGVPVIIEKEKSVRVHLGKKQKEKWLELLGEANFFIIDLASILLKIEELQLELGSHEYLGGKNTEDATPIFELEIPSGEILEVDNPFVVLKETIIDFIFRISYRSKEDFNDFLYQVKKIRISARARCPDVYTPRKIARILCNKYCGGMYKNGIYNYHRCKSCPYHDGDFGQFDDGTNLKGYNVKEVRFRRLGTKI